MLVNLLLAYAGDAHRDALAHTLVRRGIPLAGAYPDGASVLRAARKLGACMVLAAPRLRDMTAQELQDSLGGGCFLFVLCRPGEEASAAARGLRPMALPATAAELAETVRALLRETEAREREANRRNPNEEALVLRAKDMIQRQTGCTEADAHRALQRLSMRQRLPMAKAAQRILEGG